jgi:hypothetical protein
VFHNIIKHTQEVGSTGQEETIKITHIFTMNMYHTNHNGGKVLSKIKLYSNGFILKTTNSRYVNYIGVEGDCWSIDGNSEGVEQKETEDLYNYYCENIDLSWRDNTSIDACCDIHFLNRYISMFLKTGIKFDVLYCKTDNVFARVISGCFN